MFRQYGGERSTSQLDTSSARITRRALPGRIRAAATGRQSLKRWWSRSAPWVRAPAPAALAPPDRFRELEVVDNGPDVKGGSADHHWDDVASRQSGSPVGPAAGTPPPSRFADVEQINHVMTDFRTLGLGRLGGADSMPR